MYMLVVSAISVACFHSLAPDHWLPFVALARGSRWSMRQLGLVTTLAGIGHVASSLLIGLVGLWAGWAVHRLEGVEIWRGGVALWLLIGFGAAYAIWGLKHAGHAHHHTSIQDTVLVYAQRRVWWLTVVLVFGPCEPLVPLMFLSYQQGMAAVWMTSLAFSIVTVGMVVGQSCLTYAGVRLIAPSWMERYAHACAGLVIVATGLAIMALGV